ncbi:MAG TPA: hypothetical protein VHT75_04145 [Acidimicrobiales bacterium]|nr:hypothetical protein [Acidimicrobiales bacterium]
MSLDNAIRSHPLFQDLLGCQWGRRISLPDDSRPCAEQAVQIVVLHDGDDEVDFKLCAHHRELVKTHTDPHREPER